MSYSPHDNKHKIEAYLDDLDSHSHKRMEHPKHLHLVFERCHYYKTLLNPNNCILVVTYGWLLGCIVSKEWINVDPFKVEAIL